jgi:hypothetical protein
MDVAVPSIAVLVTNYRDTVSDQENVEAGTATVKYLSSWLPETSSTRPNNRHSIRQRYPPISLLSVLLVEIVIKTLF